MNPHNLINWAELSRTLAGNRSSITKDRVPIIHRKKINQLLKAVEKWLNDQSNVKTFTPNDPSG